MSDLTSILIATDLSARSDRAMARATALARTHGARLILLSVVDDAMPEDLTESIADKVRHRLDRIAQPLREELTVEDHVHVGDPTETLLHRTAEIAPSLLVLGVHRPRPFLDMLRETTMQRIVRRTDCPVLLVRDPAEGDYTRIAAATDFSPAATAALRLAHQLAPAAEITPVHVVHVPYQGMLSASGGSDQALTKAFLKDARRDDTAWRGTADLPQSIAETEIVDGSAYRTLRQRAESGAAQLITAGAHGRVGAAPAILGSLATDLMRDPPCDILIARPRR